LRFKAVSDAIGTILFLFGFTLMAPLLTGLVYGEDPGELLVAFGSPAVLGWALALALKYYGRAASDSIRDREALFVVSVLWVIMAFLGAFPYYLLGSLTDPVDAFFESMSGFTSTGATVFTTLEGVPHSILLWRSFTQWLGGMGVIVLSVAVLTRLLKGRSGILLMSGELPGVSMTRLKPRIQQTALLLWEIYVAFTVIEVVFLYLAGMNLFDAVCHSFTTLPGGGFGTHDGNIEYFNNPAIEIVLMLFMFLGSVNFVLHYRFIKGRFSDPLNDPEFRVYLTVIGMAVTLVVADLTLQGFYSLPVATRHGAFQVMSIVTTTGYNSVDFGQWPALSQMVLMILMFTGAMSGSTSGALKIARIFIIIKGARRVVHRIAHPRSVEHLRIGGHIVDDGLVGKVGAYLFIYIMLLVMSTLVLAVLGADVVTGMTACLTCIGNVGPGLGSVGPALNFSVLHPLSKLTLCGIMWMGRLEIMACLILFFPATYKK